MTPLDRARTMVTLHREGETWQVVLHGERPSTPPFPVHQTRDEDKAKQVQGRLLVVLAKAFAILQTEGALS